MRPAGEGQQKAGGGRAALGRQMIFFFLKKSYFPNFAI
jgi:hypothetical protein